MDVSSYERIQTKKNATAYYVDESGLIVAVECNGCKKGKAYEEFSKHPNLLLLHVIGGKCDACRPVKFKRAGKQKPPNEQGELCCTACEEWKKPEEFYWKKALGKRDNACKKCRLARARVTAKAKEERDKKRPWTDELMRDELAKVYKRKGAEGLRTVNMQENYAPLFTSICTKYRRGEFETPKERYANAVYDASGLDYYADVCFDVTSYRGQGFALEDATAELFDALGFEYERGARSNGIDFRVKLGARIRYIDVKRSESTLSQALSRQDGDESKTSLKYLEFIPEGEKLTLLYFNEDGNRLDHPRLHYMPLRNIIGLLDEDEAKAFTAKIGAILNGDETAGVA